MRLFYLTSIIAFIVSYASKLLADALLHSRVAIVGSFAGLEPVQNPGVAFGVQLPSGFQELLIIAALVFVCVLAWKTKRTTVSSIGYGLIVGGALGNVIDRALDGFVTDFFQVGNFAIFNVADSCITVGVVFLLAEALGLVRNK